MAFLECVCVCVFDSCGVDSSILQLDETEEKVRAIPEKRCVLILREIPKDTPKEVREGGREGGHFNEYYDSQIVSILINIMSV